MHATSSGGLSTTFLCRNGSSFGGILGCRGIVVVGIVPMTRSAHREPKISAMFLLRPSRRGPIPLQDLSEADGIEESETPKGKSFVSGGGLSRVRSAIKGNGGEKQEARIWARPHPPHNWLLFLGKWTPALEGSRSRLGRLWGEGTRGSGRRHGRLAGRSTMPSPFDAPAHTASGGSVS